MDVYQLSAVAQIVGAGSIVFGLIFGTIQITHLRQERRDRAAAELMHMFQSREFFSAFKDVIALPPGTTAESIRDREEAVADNLNWITFLFEELGLLVYRRVIPIHLVNEAMGGFLRIAWARMRPWIEAERERLDAPTMGEWFQWLCERLEEHPSLKKQPAHIRYAKWTP